MAANWIVKKKLGLYNTTGKWTVAVRVGPKKVNLIVATCWSRPMWDMVIECLLDTFWPDPSKDLRSPRLPLPGGGCYDLGTPRMVHFDRDSKSMWKSYILSKFWLHNELDILTKKSPNIMQEHPNGARFRHRWVSLMQPITDALSVYFFKSCN